jgi:hypothetical protein
MKQNIILSLFKIATIVFIQILAFLNFNTFANEKNKIEAEILSYESVCKINKPQKPPIGIIWSKGTWNQEGCGNIEKAFGHPKALKILIENNSNEKYSFPVKKDFENFSKINTKFSKPIAIQVMSGGFLGYLKEVPNIINFIVDAKSIAELVIFYENLPNKAIIEFEGFEPVQLK